MTSLSVNKERPLNAPEILRDIYQIMYYQVVPVWSTKARDVISVSDVTKCMTIEAR